MYSEVSNNEYQNKKKMKFLDKEKRNNLKDSIINGRQKYAREFKKQFLGSYVGWKNCLRGNNYLTMQSK